MNAGRVNLYYSPGMSQYSANVPQLVLFIQTASYRVLEERDAVPINSGVSLNIAA